MARRGTTTRPCKEREIVTCRAIPMMNSSTFARSAVTTRFPRASLSVYSRYDRLSERRVENRLPDYLQGWADADPAKIRAAVTASYRFHDPLIGTFSRRSLHEYFHLLLVLGTDRQAGRCLLPPRSNGRAIAFDRASVQPGGSAGRTYRDLRDQARGRRCRLRNRRIRPQLGFQPVAICFFKRRLTARPQRCPSIGMPPQDYLG